MTIAVIDIGSNSIKLLVATRRGRGAITALHQETLDARISAGLGRARPRLQAAGMRRGVAAIKALLDQAARFAPDRVILVATSAVRDAVNGTVLRNRVKKATGHSIRILSGDEEAALIGRGLTSDSALAKLRNFYVFDLGGGSLECLAFRQRRIVQATSLPLGCVRLTEKFVRAPRRPFSSQSATAVAEHTRTVLAASGFRFDLPQAQAVFAGGTMTTVRAILAKRRGRTLESTSAKVAVTQLQKLQQRIAPMTLARRKKVPGLPPPRADVFPTALATVLAIAQAARLRGFHHSLRNLRWGVAASVL